MVACGMRQSVASQSGIEAELQAQLYVKPIGSCGHSSGKTAFIIRVRKKEGDKWHRLQVSKCLQALERCISQKRGNYSALGS